MTVSAQHATKRHYWGTYHDRQQREFLTLTYSSSHAHHLSRSTARSQTETSPSPPTSSPIRPQTRSRVSTRRLACPAREVHLCLAAERARIRIPSLEEIVVGVTNGRKFFHAEEGTDQM